MIISTFVSPETGNLLYYVPGNDQAFGFSVDDWLGAYAEELGERLETEGQGRELIAASFESVSDDRYILNLRVSYPDGRSVSVRETLLLARFTDSDGHWTLASIGGVPASQS